MAPVPSKLPNLWHVFNLRESPFFQDILGSSHHSYPLSLFVGRVDETQQLLETIGGTRSSRQAIGGPPGVGKTTLVQSVKAGAIAAGYWAADELVPFYDNDTTEEVLGRLLNALYDTILAARPMTADNAVMKAAQQLVKVTRLTGGGANFSLPTIGGLGLSRSSTALTPNGAMLMDGPRIMRDMLALVRDAETNGVVLHLNNLENLTEAGTERAADVLRSLRDQVLMLDGLHILLVGTATAVFRATGAHAQVRSVFTTPLSLEPLPIQDIQRLLGARYEHLALNGATPVAPAAPHAVAALYPLFRGDIRSLLSALEQGVRLLVGTVPAGESLSLDLLRPALRERYTALLRERLDERGQQQLEAWAAMGASSEQTQQALQQAWKLSQSKVSKVLAELELRGYVVALPREGRAPIRYVFTGVSQLIYG
jgi:hypothetical protein